MEDDRHIKAQILFDTHKHLAVNTVYRVFKNPRGIAKKYNIELDDLFQYANEALYESCLDYDENIGNCKFSTFAITKIRWNLTSKIQRDCKNFSFRGTGLDAREVRAKTHFVSLDDSAKELDESGTYHEVVASDYDLEGNAIGNILTEYLGNKCPERVKEMLKLRIDGLTLEEIGEQCGLSRERVRQLLNKVKKELEGVI
jgi:RNA polymerase sigma factor (sigma-70 family)